MTQEPYSSHVGGERERERGYRERREDKRKTEKRKKERKKPIFVCLKDGQKKEREREETP